MNGMSMFAAVLYGREDVRVEAVPVPAVGPGEVRVRIGAALTCGTDLKVFRRGYHARMIVPPAVFGHEFAGEIDAVGPGVRHWAPGMRVVAANSAACDACFYCHKGHPELCEDLVFVNGAYAEYITLPAQLVRRNLLSLPPHLSFEQAAMTEPLACVVRGMDETPVQPGDTVVVLGAGQIGLLFVRLCRLAGARVICVGRRPARLSLAREMGAEVTLSAEPGVDVVEEARAHTPRRRGPDVVVECVGQRETWEQAIAMPRKAGTVNLFGGCPRDTFVQIDTSRVHYDEITLRGTFHHTPDTVRRALRLIVDGDVPASALIQQHADLHELPSVLRSLMNGNCAVKVAISPRHP
ncbi:MAG: zinc-binding dehydrogenase [Chthonomonadales bacterium]|nr:zinc-binding dehydrogenase [Chthonomonadales bacterium]